MAESDAERSRLRRARRQRVRDSRRPLTRLPYSVRRSLYTTRQTAPDPGGTIQARVPLD